MTFEWDVIGVGANSVDHVLVLSDNLPSLTNSTKITVKSKNVRCGGQTATALATCAAFGLKTKYIGAIGRDESGRMVRENLVQRGIDVADMVERDAATQMATILVHSATGSRIVLWQRDPLLRLRASEISANHLRRARIVHVDDVDDDAAIAAARAACAAGVSVTSDIDHVSEHTEELIAAVTYPIFAEEALHPLTGMSDPASALRALRQRHAGVLCVTLGNRGAMAIDGDQLHVQPPFPVAVCDTTGAGDVFRGGFIYGVLQRWDVRRTLAFATAAAGLACTRLGAMDGAPTLEEVLGLLNNSRRVTSDG